MGGMGRAWTLANRLWSRYVMLALSAPVHHLQDLFWLKVTFVVRVAVPRRRRIARQKGAYMGKRIVVDCPGKVATYWKAKKDADKWLKKTRISCSSKSKCST